ncbi:MAG: LysM peptidoglycan-binding domain-containing protein [Lachnospiraceae bacterium]
MNRKNKRFLNSRSSIVLHGLLKLLKEKTALIIITFTAVILSLTLITAVAANGSNVEKTKYYKSILIQSGDTLWNIAEEYYDKDNTTIIEYIDELKQINGISDENIKSGNYLVISYYND